MMSPRPRLMVAIVVAGASVLPGAGLAAAAEDPVLIAPGGGCWRYVPGPGEDIGDATGITDLSTELEGWVPDDADPGILLTTAGATAVGGLRTFAVDVPVGPVVEPVPTEATDGTATFLLAQGATDLPPVEVELEVEPSDEPGAPALVPALRAEGSFQLTAPGSVDLTLRALYVDLPGLDLRIACNGQTAGEPGGDNPATSPIDTAVTTTFAVREGSGAVVTAVRDQAVLSAARPGDTVVVDGVGFPAKGTGALQWCSAGGACRPAGDIAALVDGTWRLETLVPADLAPGAWTLRSTVGDRVDDLALTILDVPAVSAAERGSGSDARARIDGTGWDPQRPVLLRPVDTDGERAGKAVTVAPGPTGAFGVQIPLDRSDAVAIRATQQRTASELAAEVELAAAAGKSPAAGPGTTQGTIGSAVPRGETAVVAPVDIPAPAPMPVAEVPAPGLVAPGDEAAAPEDQIAVVDATLTGSPSLGEMFGASPRRVLRLTVENTAEVAATAPGLTIAVGRAGSSEPIYESDGLGRIEAGATEILEVPIALGVGAIGTYEITGQIGSGEAGRFALSWQTFPWGLIGLNVLGIALVAWALERRVSARHRPTVVAAVAAVAAGSAVEVTGPAGADDPGAAVIDIATLERWWALPTGTTLSGVSPADGAVGVAGPAGAADPSGPADGLSVVDVDAADAWFERLPARDVATR